MANLNINEFTANVNRWIDAVDSGVSDIAQEMLKNVHHDLVVGSPVDTGRFRGNWQVTFDRIPLHSLNRYDKDGNETIAEGNAEIAKLLQRGAAVTTVYFSNMLIYANSLEYGHSKQAPNGVVGIVALRLRSYFADAVRKSRSKNAL